MLRTSLALLLLAIGTTPNVAASKQIVVRWGNSNLKVSDENADLNIRRTNDPDFTSKPRVECAIQSMRTICVRLFQIKKNTDDNPYGKNMRFVKPIAILPSVILEATDTNSPEGVIPDEVSRQPAVVSKLPPYRFTPVTVQQVVELLNHFSYLGSWSQSYIFSDAELTEGGTDALSLWRALIGKRPPGACDGSGDDNVGDSCAAIVQAKKEGNEAIAYCEFIQSKLGDSLPLRCETVAFVRDNRWMIVSYDGPEQCGGCGAVDGATCEFETKLPLQKVADLVVDAFKGGKTNMPLVVESSSDHKIKLAGKKIGANSRWKLGYFEKSSANYTVSLEAGSMEISGVYQLLLNSDPSTDENDNWIEFGDIHWFQGQILKLLQREIVDKISTTKQDAPPCSNNF
jgi:hypothetical protein